MKSALKLIAILLTLALVALIFTGIIQGWFLNTTFWVVYLLIALLDLLVIARLKRT
jgi:hypothetical protein